MVSLLTFLSITEEMVADQETCSNQQISQI
uniref:Uncharacterized protein n=1 Tax=Myoviridae sp. ctBtT5 TaxID=2825048 RepID=A0A8S5PYX7_9CAUD|nr:MAG TPA: hypothetical protein [Myoviridae sp. ctBtT5]